MLQGYYVANNGFTEGLEVDLYVYDRNAKSWFDHSCLNVEEIVDEHDQGKIDFILHLDDGSGDTIKPFWDENFPLSWFFDANMNGEEEKTWENFVVLCKTFVELFEDVGFDLFKPDPGLPRVF